MSIQESKKKPARAGRRLLAASLHQGAGRGAALARRIAACGALLACLSTAAGADDGWPRFRGPQADGVAPDNPGLPTTWTATDNVKWAAGVRGWGWSSPVVWGNRVFVASVHGDQENAVPHKGLYLGQGVREPAKGVHHWMIRCLDLDSGRKLWKREVHAGRPKVPRHPKNTYASETPATDGERLYVLFGDLGLYCCDLDGKLLWSRRIEPKKTFFDYGAAASPVVHDGQVIVVYDNLEDSWIAAFDAKTGATRWRTSRDEKRSWATPFVWENELRTEIVVPGMKRNRSYSLDGRLLWEFDGRMSNLVIPSPFAAHGLCYISSGYVGDRHRPTFAIRPGASGDFTPEGDFAASKYIAWYQGTSSAYNPSQTVYGDYLYTLYDRGFLTCHDARTGREVYGKQRFSPRGSFTASPCACNGYLFCLSEDGLTYVVKAGPEFKIVARNPLDELCLASPAIVGDKLLIRTASRLYCLTRGAKLDAAAAARRTPRRKTAASADIWSAAAEGRRDEVARFLTAHARVNARQPGTGSTPLNTAVVFGHDDIARLLMEKGADVSLPNADGNTALHIASFFARRGLVRLLLEKGAPLNVKNGRGETPLDVVSGAWSRKLEEMYRSLENLLGIELDLEQIRKTRPAVAALLREHATRGEAKGAAPKAPQALAGTSWVRLPDMELPRWEAGTVVLDDKLYVFGGYRMPTKSCRRVDVFDPQDNSWQKFAELPSAITHMNAVLDGRTVWIAGGFKNGYKGYATDEVWKYDIDGKPCTAGPSLPEPRAGGGLALVGRRLHYIGGLKKDRDTDASDHWVLDLGESARGHAGWSNAAPMPQPRNQFGTAVLGGKIYVLGGMFHHDSGQDDQARVDVYDPGSDSWSRGPDLPGPHSHAEGSTFVHDGRIYVVGGMTREDGRRRIDNKVLALSAAGKWQVLARLPVPLSSPVAAILRDRFFVGGGSPNGATPQPRMWARSAP